MWVYLNRYGDGDGIIVCVNGPLLGFFSVLRYHIPVTEKMLRAKLREKFDENRHVTDLRAIDLLVVKVRYQIFTWAGIVTITVKTRVV